MVATELDELRAGKYAEPGGGPNKIYLTGSSEAETARVIWLKLSKTVLCIVAYSAVRTSP